MSGAATIEQELERRGNCFLQTTGMSMEPILHQHHSTVVVEPLDRPPRKNDVVLYHIPDGPYVIHRVRKVRERDYFIRGDNCVNGENVPPEWLVGLVTGFYNGDDYTSCADAAYLRYVRTVGLRWGYLRCRAYLAAAWHKLIGR